MFDEAHRATGNFAYVKVCRGIFDITHLTNIYTLQFTLFSLFFIPMFGANLEFLQHPDCHVRIMALSATPGNDLQAVQTVLNTLAMQRIEAKW